MGDGRGEAGGHCCGERFENAGGILEFGEFGEEVVGAHSGSLEQVLLDALARREETKETYPFYGTGTNSGFNFEVTAISTPFVQVILVGHEAAECTSGCEGVDVWDSG